MFDFAKKRMDLGLKRIKKAMEILDNPENEYRVILVAGTNGKGSTTSYLSNILKEAGYKVGSFYSPHLVNWDERIRINNKKIRREEAEMYINEIKEVSKKADLTYFEALTAFSYLYFKEKKVDYAIMEVGLGGRWDATNIAKEELSIITRISLDHTHILGKSLADIAREKAEVIKYGDVVVNNMCDVFTKKAKSIKKKAFCMRKDFGFREVSVNMYENEFKYFSNDIEEKVKTSMVGYNQVENASEAIKAAEILGVGFDSIKKGLEEAKKSGRFEIFYDGRVVVDVAHNPNGMKALKKNLNKIFPGKKVVAVFGVMKDKDWKEMLDILQPKELIAVEIDNKRSEKANNIINWYGKGKAFKDVIEGLEYALHILKDKEIIVITGSIYVIGELYKKMGWRVE